MVDCPAETAGLRRSGSGGLAEIEMNGEHDFANREAARGETLEEKLAGAGAPLLGRRLHGGDERPRIAARLEAVEAGNANLAGDGDAARREERHRGDRQPVVGADDGTGEGMMVEIGGNRTLRRIEIFPGRRDDI